MEKRSNRRQKKRFGWKRSFLLLFAAFFIVVGILTFSAYNQVKSTLNGKDLTSEKRTDEIELNKEQGFTVLLLGVDKRENDNGRSDTMILMSVRGDSVKMLSIPRDTRVEIVGKGTEDKINHAYAFGGINMAAQTVEKFLDIPVDYYVEMNMEGLRELVDAVGGVSVDNPFAFDYEGITFSKGTIQLSGEEALKYSRMRYDDPNGDFGRQARQRQVIQAVIAKGSNPETLLKYKDILKAVGGNVETNLSLREMTAIQKNYKGAQKNIQSETIDGAGKKINGVYYYIVSNKEKERLTAMLKDHLGIK